MKRHRIFFTDTQIEALYQIKAETGDSPSVTVRRAVAEYLEKQKEGKTNG